MRVRLQVTEGSSPYQENEVQEPNQKIRNETETQNPKAQLTLPHSVGEFAQQPSIGTFHASSLHRSAGELKQVFQSGGYAFTKYSSSKPPTLQAAATKVASLSSKPA
jgi:hypothetical protein